MQKNGPKYDSVFMNTLSEEGGIYLSRKKLWAAGEQLLMAIFNDES